MTKKLLMACACLCALMMGCSDDDAANNDRIGDAGTSNVGDEVKVEITAKKGGKVETKGAALTLPAGALAKDTEITVETVAKKGLADEKNIASAVYDFGPDGTKFEKPVTLTIDFDKSGAPKDSVATLAWLDGNKWTALADSKVDGDSVVGTTDHFTKFAVVWKQGAGQTEGQCMEDFEPCGGDIEGTWEFSASCATVPEDFLGLKKPGGTFEDCDDLTVAVVAELTGEITFDADGKFQNDGAQNFDVVITIPKKCLPMGVTDCSLFESDKEDGGTTMSTITETAEACINTVASMQMSMDTGTYSTDGDKLVTMNDDEGPDAGPPDDDTYCVSGDKLTVRAETADGTVIYYSATKK